MRAQVEAWAIQNKLDPREVLELWDERAGIRENDDVPKPIAEREAFLDIKARWAL